MRILHDSKDERFKKPFGALKSGENCWINILIPKTCPAKRVFIVMEKDGEEEKLFEMKYSKTEEDYICFECEISLEIGLHFYWFKIEKEESSFLIFKENYKDTNMECGEKWQITCYDGEHHPPKWACGKVIYQIFPDRFNKAGCPDLSGKILPYTVHKSESETPNPFPDSEGNYNTDFFGGNLPGIIEKLPYIKDMGVGIIYLNPIVKAFSNHRYDTADYLAVDPMLGTTDDFKFLCDKAHLLDIKVIVDGVFSHTGEKSIYFESAVNDKNSTYREWYDFKKFPYDYKSWWGIKTLPQIKHDQKDFMEFISNKVIPFWLGLGADGIRLDVADELTDNFISKISKSAKKVKNDALIMGEVWEDASNKISYDVRRRYLFGNELDSVMNYPFSRAIIRFVKGEINAERFEIEIMSIVENYPPEILNCCMNMLSTHDTSRIYSVLKEKTKIAAFLQFMLPGSPSIYYGDEIGMEGEKDPFNRGYFKWDNVDCQLNMFFKTVSKLKNNLADLKTSVIRFENLNGVLIFYRNNLKVIVNLTDAPFKTGGRIIFGENYNDNEILNYGFALVDLTNL